MQCKENSQQQGVSEGCWRIFLSYNARTRSLVVGVKYRYYATFFLWNQLDIFLRRRVQISLDFHQRFSLTARVSFYMFELLNCSMQTKATTARKNHVCYIKLPPATSRLLSYSLFSTLSPNHLYLYLLKRARVYHSHHLEIVFTLLFNIFKPQCIFHKVIKNNF